MAPPDQLHKAMVGELFLVFLIYIYHFFKFPKKYVNDDATGAQNQSQAGQPGMESSREPDAIDSNRNKADKKDKPRSPPPAEKDVKFTERLLVLFTHHTVAVGAAFFSPFAFEITITWLHLPVFLLYVYSYHKRKVTLGKLLLVLMYIIDIALILSGIIERNNGFVVFADNDALGTTTSSPSSSSSSSSTNSTSNGTNSTNTTS